MKEDSLNKAMECVVKFHKAFGVPILDKPGFPSFDRLKLRMHLIEEETLELRDAFVGKDIVAAADALCDIIYVALGAACELGLQERLGECFDEVQRSNMSKLNKFGAPVHREDGKVMKSDLYSPPDLRSIIEK